MGGLDASINAWAGGWSDGRFGSSVEFSVPGEHRQVGWSVSLPLGWSAAPTQGVAGVGSSVNVVATSPSCSRSADPLTPVPATPTQPPRWCPGATYGPRGSYIGLSVSGAPTYAAGGTRQFQFGDVPPSVPGAGFTTVPESSIISMTYDWSTLRTRDFEAGHTGFGRVRLAIWDQTARVWRLNVDAARPGGDPLFPPSGWALTPQRAELVDLDVSGSPVWHHYSRAHGTWDGASSVPQRGFYLRNPSGTTAVSFVPERGHRYAIWSTAAHDACTADFAAWRIAFVEAACEGDGCPPPSECPDGRLVCPPGPIDQQPIPTPAPPPPPQPPAAEGELRLLMHSQHDPNHGGGAARDAVYRSNGTTVAWPQGEILDFAPDVTLEPLPQTPFDPYWGRLYRFEQQVVGWSFVTDAACRGAAKKLEHLRGCGYAYVPEPTEAQMQAQARAMWSGGNPAPAPDDVYSVPLARLQPVELPVEVLVETRTIDSLGTVLRRRQTTLSATYRVELVAPRSVR